MLKYVLLSSTILLSATMLWPDISFASAEPEPGAATLPALNNSEEIASFARKSYALATMQSIEDFPSNAELAHFARMPDGFIVGVRGVDVTTLTDELSVDILSRLSGYVDWFIASFRNEAPAIDRVQMQSVMELMERAEQLQDGPIKDLANRTVIAVCYTRLNQVNQLVGSLQDDAHAQRQGASSGRPMCNIPLSLHDSIQYMVAMGAGDFHIAMSIALQLGRVKEYYKENFDSFKSSAEACITALHTPGFETLPPLLRSIMSNVAGNYIITMMRDLIGANDNQFYVSLNDPIRLPRRESEKLDELLAILEDTIQFMKQYDASGEKVQTYIVVKKCLIVQRLQGSLTLPAEEIFRHATQFLQLQREYPAVFPPSSDFPVLLRVAGVAAQYAPSYEAEQACAQYAYDNFLPQIPEDSNIYTYYLEKLREELSRTTLAPSNRRLKKIYKHQEEYVDDLDPLVIARIDKHIFILNILGRYVESVQFLTRLARDRQVYYEQLQKQKPSKKKTMEHKQLVAKIKREMKEAEEAQARAEEAIRLRAEIEAQRLARRAAIAHAPVPYWDLPGYTRPNQAEARAALSPEKKHRRRDEGAAAEILPDAAPAPVAAASAIPDEVLAAIRAHRKTFDDIFAGNAVTRESFFNFIVSIGGEVRQAGGSHMFASLTLGEFDLDLLPNSAYKEFAARKKSKSKAYGQMTLSQNDHSRYLSPEQIEDAQAVLTMNGLTPERIQASLESLS